MIHLRMLARIGICCFATLLPLLSWGVGQQPPSGPLVLIYGLRAWLPQGWARLGAPNQPLAWSSTADPSGNGCAIQVLRGGNASPDPAESFAFLWLDVAKRMADPPPLPAGGRSYLLKGTPGLHMLANDNRNPDASKRPPYFGLANVRVAHQEMRVAFLATGRDNDCFKKFLGFLSSVELDVGERAATIDFDGAKALGDANFQANMDQQIVDMMRRQYELNQQRIQSQNLQQRR